jgi:hypothetical protein
VILNPPCSGCCSRVGAKLAVVVHLEGVAVHGVVYFFSLYDKKLTTKQTEKIVPNVVAAIEIRSSPPF